MKRILPSLLLLAAMAALLAPSRLLAATEVVDGIEWTHTISGGKATVIKAKFATEAVPTVCVHPEDE